MWHFLFVWFCSLDWFLENLNLKKTIYFAIYAESYTLLQILKFIYSFSHFVILKQSKSTILSLQIMRHFVIMVGPMFFSMMGNLVRLEEWMVPLEVKNLCLRVLILVTCLSLDVLLIVRKVNHFYFFYKNEHDLLLWLKLFYHWRHNV